MIHISELLNWLPPDFLAELDKAGYLIAPREPTADMKHAGYAAINSGQKGTVGIYRAMVAAAAPKVTE